MMTILVRNMSKSFGQPPVEVLHDISFEIADGEFVALTGKSGSGKSTLLYLISTLDNPTGGSVELSGQNVAAMNSHELHHFRNRRLGFVFQFHHLLPELTALENALLPARKAHEHHEREELALSFFQQFDLVDKVHSRPGQLSGGEQQRVAIIRALIMEPEYIFADEPTGNLDSRNARIVLDIFRNINRERKTTIVMVTHDEEFAGMADRQIVLADGRLAGTD